MQDIESLLNLLPSYIKVYDATILADFECDKYAYYAFALDKDYDNDSVYELSYFCYSWDKELISFTGSLREVTEKMVAWCKENGYLMTVK